MLALLVKCAHCEYEEWITVSKWNPRCPNCGRIGLYVKETHPHAPRIVRLEKSNGRGKGNCQADNSHILSFHPEHSGDNGDVRL